MVKENIQRYVDRGNNIKNNYQRVEKENLIINRNSNSKNTNTNIYIEKNNCIIIDKQKTIDLANENNIFISTCNKFE